MSQHLAFAGHQIDLAEPAEIGGPQNFAERFGGKIRADDADDFAIAKNR